MYCLFSVIIYIIAFFDLQKSFEFDESASINTVSSSAHAIFPNHEEDCWLDSCPEPQKVIAA